MKRPMTMILPAVLILLFALSGCSAPGNGKTPPPRPADPLPVPEISVIAADDVPDFILQNYAELTSERYYAYQLEGVLYLIAAMGERPSSGYSIWFSHYRDNLDHTWDVFLETEKPGQDEPVLTVLTYPAAFARFHPDLPIFHIRFHVDGQETQLVTVETLTAPQEETEVSLYFATEDAYLRREPRPVSVSYLSQSPEKQAEILMLELFTGSMAQFGTVSVIPAGTELTGIVYQPAEQLLDITVSAQFANLAGSAAEQLAVYSIVNTLTQIEGVNEVTIMIEGGELQHMGELGRLTYHSGLVAAESSI